MERYVIAILKGPEAEKAYDALPSEFKVCAVSKIRREVDAKCAVDEIGKLICSLPNSNKNKLGKY